MKTQNQKRYLFLLALVLVLAVQTVMMGYFGNKKAGYHVDEVYTYELSNYPGTFFSETEGFLDTWVDGSFFQESMSVDGLGDLDYATVYHNQENDVHPPIYYFVIHTVAALFHGEVSKWIGILPNMFFCLLTTVLLYLVAARLFPNRVLALLAAAMWAWSVGTMTTAVFIRMYALLTCIATALVLVHLKALEDVRRGKLRKRTAALLFVVTLLGILTQYYFLVFCFFLCGIFFLCLCATRRWKLLGVYTVLEGGALCAAVAIFPKMLFHIFGGYRGKQAFGSMATKEGTLDGLKKVASIISRQLFNGWLKECILLVVAVVVVYFLVKHVLHLRLFPKGEEVGMAVEMDVHMDRKLRLHISHVDVAVALLGVVAVGYWGLVGKVAPYKTDRYFFCIYPLIVLCMVYLGYRTLMLLVRNPQRSTIALAVVALGITAMSYRTQTVNYLFLETNQRAQELAGYEEYPVIILSVQGTPEFADAQAMEFPEHSQIYRCGGKDFAALSDAVESKDLEGGFLLFIRDFGKMSQEEIQEQVEAQLDLDQFELLTRIGCNVYFCTLEEAAS